jgi:hypothetical protein
VFLLSHDARCPSWRACWTLPVLVVWGNVHGSVTLGVGLVALRGLTSAWQWRRQRGPRGLGARALVLLIGAPVALLITPYGLRAVAYYHSTLGNSALRHVVSEWQPVTSSALIAVPFFALAAIMIWSFGRFPARSTLWDRLALLALAAATVEVIRNVPFFALCALAILPLSLAGPGTDAAPAGISSALQRRVNGALLGFAAATAVLAGVVVIGRPAQTLQPSFLKGAMLSAVARAAGADRTLKVVADSRYANWLLWRDPALHGRMAADARFELYSAHELYKFQELFSALGLGWKSAARGYRLLVLDRSADSEAVTGFLHEPHARVLYRDARAIVILRSRASG